MTRISYKRHRFPPAIIQHAVWLYFRFTLSCATSRGAVRQMRSGLWYSRLSATGDPNGANILQATPLSASDHPARRLALLPLHRQPARCRGDARPACHRSQLRSHPMLDHQARTKDRSEPSTQEIEQTMMAPCASSRLSNSPRALSGQIYALKSGSGRQSRCAE